MLSISIGEFQTVCTVSRRETHEEALPPVRPNCWKCFRPAYVILALRVSFLHLHLFHCHFVWSHSLQIFLLDILDTAILYSSIQTVCSLLIPYLLPA